MELFISKGDEARFKRALAIYATAARTRGEQIESVLATCCGLADSQEGLRPAKNEVIIAPHKVQDLIFSGILREFYGDVAVERAIRASAQCKADAKEIALSVDTHASHFRLGSPGLAHLAG